jgi:hypothetical protein
LQYFAIGTFSYAVLRILTTGTDALTVTKAGLVIETETATPAELEGSKPLSDYPPLYLPVLVGATGKVLVSCREIEAEDVRRHRVIRKNAMDAMKDGEETGDEGDAPNKGDSTTGAIELQLPPLKYSQRRAPIFPTSKAGVKGENEDTDNDEMDVEEEGGGGKAKAKAKAKEKKEKEKEKEKEKKSKKRPRQVTITSSDEDEDAEETKEEHASKRRKKSSKSGGSSS